MRSTKLPFRNINYSVNEMSFRWLGIHIAQNTSKSLDKVTMS